MLKSVSEETARRFLLGPATWAVLQHALGLFEMTLSRDWWAVILAVTAAVLVKLGLIAGIPW